MRQAKLNVLNIDWSMVHPSYLSRSVFEITVKGIAINCSYELFLDHAPHLKFVGALTPTGFYSHFFVINHLSFQTVPLVEYAILVVDELLKSSVSEPEQEQGYIQLSLF